jgi:hypothetical protein
VRDCARISLTLRRTFYRGVLCAKLKIRSSSKWTSYQWERYVRFLRPAEEGHVVERFDDGSFQLDHHFQICVILDRVDVQFLITEAGEYAYLYVVRIKDRYPPIDYHILRMESACYRSVIILSLS